MASRKFRSDKRLQNLQKENRKLNKDVKVLEDGLLLHQRFQDVEDSSVGGLLRKEIGGSRWEHGGSGKLTTYKDTRDLQDPYGFEKKENVNAKKVTKTNKGIEDKSNKRFDNQLKEKSSIPHTFDAVIDHQDRKRMKVNTDQSKTGANISECGDGHHYSSNNKNTVVDSGLLGQGSQYDNDKLTSLKTQVLDGQYDDDRMASLKTQVLKKVSSGVINRKKNPTKFGETFEKRKDDIILGEIPKYEKSKTDGKDKTRSDGSVTFMERKNGSTIVMERKKDKVKYDGSLTLADKPEDSVISDGSVTLTDRKRAGSKRKNASSKLGGKANGKMEKGDFLKIEPEKELNGNMKEVEILQKTELFSDSHRDIYDFGNQHGQSITVNNQHEEFENKSIDEETKTPFENKHRSDSDVQGDWKYDLDYQPSENIFSLTTNSSYVPKCNPDVKLWLRRLGLLEEEKYFKIFAENEIDMNELTQLTFEQLQDMGVVAIGALNKILRGIRELKLDLDKQKLKENMPSPKIKSDTPLKYEHSSTLAYHIDFDFSKKDLNQQPRGDGSQHQISDHKFSFVEPNFRFIPTENRGHGLEENGDKNTSNLRRSASEMNHPEESNYRSDTVSRLRLDNGNINSKSRMASQEIDDTAIITKHSCDVQSRLATAGGQTSVKTSVQAKTNESVKRERSLTRQNSAKGKKDEFVKKEKSLTRSNSAKTTSRDGRKTQSAKSKQKKNEKNKQSVPKIPRSQSAEVFQAQAHTAIDAAARKFEEKQKQESDSNNKQKIIENKKKQRDEMAARHLEREKKKEEENQMVVPLEDMSIYGSTYVIKDTTDVMNIDLEGNKVEDMSENKSEQKEQRMLYRPRRKPTSVRHSVAVPANTLELRADNYGKHLLSSTYKVSARVIDSKQETVKDIEKEIQNLQNMAISGEQVTMDLVKDLQQRLEKIEIDMSDKQSPVSLTTKSAMTPFDLAHKDQSLPKDSSDSESDDDYADDSPLKGATQGKKGTSSHGNISVASVSMSKKQLLNEIKKEKEKHRKQIKHLYSELQTIKHTDPLRTTELDIADITFETSDLIGQGAFSRVYRGKYQGSEVAVKQLKIPLSSNDRNYFAAEVNLLQDLRHPRVVLLIGVCTTDRLPLMVLEYMARGSLFHRLHDDRSEPLDHAEYYRVAHDIALGMNYLHQHKPAVLHLDLKSMNVLICSNDRAKIADFGFSKFRHDADVKASAVTKSKPLHSSPTWMAPELLTSGEITGKADVYSFGIILWEMLTRQQPYEGSSVFQILEKVRTNKRPEVPANCPAELKDFILECWHANPARRPSFKDILKRLENMAFPPDWQALFKEAGIPDEALEDVQSARTIISLVSSRLDMETTKPSNEFRVQMIHDPLVIPIEPTDFSGERNGDSENENANELVDTSIKKSTKKIFKRNDFKSEKSVDSNNLVSGDVKVSEEDSRKISLDTKLKLMPKQYSPKPSPRPRSSIKRVENGEDMNAKNVKRGVSKSCDHLIEELKSVQEGNLSRTVRTDRGRYNEKPEKRIEIMEGLRNVTLKSNEKVSDKQQDFDESDESPVLKKTPKDDLKCKEIKVETTLMKKMGKKKPREDSDVRQSNDDEIFKNSETSQPVKTSETSQSVKISENSQPVKVSQNFEPVKTSETSQQVNLIVHVPKLQLTDMRESNDSYGANENLDDVSDFDDDSLDDSFPTPRDSLEDFILPDLPMSKVNDETMGKLSPGFIHNNSVSVEENIEENEFGLNTEMSPQKGISESRQRYSATRNKGGLFKDMHFKLTQNFGLEESDNIPELSTGKYSQSKKSNNPSRNSVEAWVDDSKVSNISKTKQSTAKCSTQIPLAPPPPPVGQIPDPPPAPVILPQKTGSLIIKPVHRAKTTVKSAYTPQTFVPKKTELTITPTVGKKPFALKSVELKDQKEALQSISKPHPNQLQDLSQVSKGTIHSIAEILKKAVSSRRIALGEDQWSPSQSVASSWSCIDD